MTNAPIQTSSSTESNVIWKAMFYFNSSAVRRGKCEAFVSLGQASVRVVSSLVYCVESRLTNSKPSFVKSCSNSRICLHCFNKRKYTHGLVKPYPSLISCFYLVCPEHAALKFNIYLLSCQIDYILHTSTYIKLYILSPNLVSKFSQKGMPWRGRKLPKH